MKYMKVSVCMNCKSCFHYQEIDKSEFDRLATKKETEVIDDKSYVYDYDGYYYCTNCWGDLW